MDALQEHILSVLKGLPPAPADGPAFFCIDRSFTVKGSGTVVAGSLVGGILKSGGEATLLPEKEKVQIRSIQSYYTEVEKAMPVSRAALNIPGKKKDELHRGMCITDSPDFFWCDTEYV